LPFDFQELVIRHLGACFKQKIVPFFHGLCFGNLASCLPPVRFAIPMNMSSIVIHRKRNTFRKDKPEFAAGAGVKVSGKQAIPRGSWTKRCGSFQ
jgi:hypothetical protein